jgi:hypothetical protein
VERAWSQGNIKRHPAWKLDLAGFVGRDHLSEQVPPKRYLAWQSALFTSPGLSARAISCCHVRPGRPNHRLSSPNKLFEALMLASPLSSRGYHVDRLVEAEIAGWLSGMAMFQGWSGAGRPRASAAGKWQRPPGV